MPKQKAAPDNCGAAIPFERLSHIEASVASQWRSRSLILVTWNPFWTTRELPSRVVQNRVSRHAIGRSRGGLSSKIHMVVDERGLPFKLALTPGQASDKAAARALLEGLPNAPAVIADRGYDWQHLIELVNQTGGQSHIQTQRDRKIERSVNRALYRQRSLVERFFCRLKHFSRVETGYDKLARNFLAAIALASARLWMRVDDSAT